MKTLLAILLACIAPALRAEPERVLVVTDADVSSVNRLLEDGWTVKHQSVAIAGAGGTSSSFKEFRSLCVFTLTPPAPEVLEAARATRAAERAAELQKRREEYLKQRAATAVEK